MFRATTRTRHVVCNRSARDDGNDGVRSGGNWFVDRRGELAAALRTTAVAGSRATLAMLASAVPVERAVPAGLVTPAAQAPLATPASLGQLARPAAGLALVAISQPGKTSLLRRW